jgi:hypothetical protein
MKAIRTRIKLYSMFNNFLLISQLIQRRKTSIKSVLTSALACFDKSFAFYLTDKAESCLVLEPLSIYCYIM